jgi:hypothetical protein
MEEQLQIALFEFYARASGQIPELALAFHVPNGGVRHPATGARFKAMGVKPGVPDVLLPVPNGKYTGLAIEMKAGKNQATDYQQWWLKQLQVCGWYTMVAHDWVPAAVTTLVYLGRDPKAYGLPSATLQTL